MDNLAIIHKSLCEGKESSPILQSSVHGFQADRYRKSPNRIGPLLASKMNKWGVVCAIARREGRVPAMKSTGQSSLVA